MDKMEHTYHVVQIGLGVVGYGYYKAISFKGFKVTAVEHNKELVEKYNMIIDELNHLYIVNEEEQQKEFLIKDNVSGGEWDWDMLANEWDVQTLKDWGLDAPIYFDDEDIDFDNINSNEDRNTDQQKKHPIASMK